MTPVILAAALVLLAHELAHYALLRWAGAKPKFVVRAWGALGVGWAFDPSGVEARKLRAQWIAGPLVGCLGWAVLMLVLPSETGLWALLLVVEVVGNGLLPGSDGWRARRWAR